MSMNGQNPVRLPARTRQTLQELLRKRDELAAALELGIGTARDCLGVPEGWQLRNLDVGFEPPAQPDNEAGGVTVAEIED